MGNSMWAIAAEEATKEEVSFIYGQLQVTMEYKVVKKGAPKRAWIEGQDSMNDRSIELTFMINPISESGLTKLITRTVLAKSWTEWGTIVWPSLRDACGVTENDSIDGKFVKAETVKNGSKYTDSKTGEVKERTTFKFHKIFNTQEECVADYLGSNPEPVLDEDDPMAISMAPVNNQELETAKMFLPALVKQAGGKKEILTTLLAGMPMVSKYFNVDSPEVKQLLAA